MRALALIPILLLLAGCSATPTQSTGSTTAVAAASATPSPSASESIDWVGSITNLYSGCIAPLGLTDFKFTKNPKPGAPYGYVTAKAGDGTILDWDVAIADTGNPLNMPDPTTQSRIDAAGC